MTETLCPFDSLIQSNWLKNLEEDLTKSKKDVQFCKAATDAGITC